jgi:hypothetical protein
MCIESRDSEGRWVVLNYHVVNPGLNDELPWIRFYHNTMRREHEVNAESGHLKPLEVVEGPRLCTRNAPSNALLPEGS